VEGKGSLCFHATIQDAVPERRKRVSFLATYVGWSRRNPRPGDRGEMAYAATAAGVEG
jgi:hypothetical protein